MTARFAATRLAASFACCLALSCCLAACTSSPAPAAMSEPQAERLALARFTEYQLGVGSINALVPISGQTFTVAGRVDWQHHRGFATIAPTATDSAAAAPASTVQLLQWTPDWLAVRGTWKGAVPDAPPPDGWSFRQWQPGAELDTVLRLILDLAADRPENAQLLRQSGAAVLRRDTVGTEAVTVYQGPSSQDGGASHTRYWVADDGSLLRFEARVGANTAWSTVDIAPGPARPVPPIPGTESGG